MDSSNGTASYKLQAIKNAIENGTLTKEEINKRLTYAISEEYQKNPADRDARFILACETILYEMHTGKPYVSRKEVYQQALLKEKKKEAAEKTKCTPRAAWRIAIACCALLVLIIAADVLLHREWLEGSSTENEQQYIVSGEETDLDAISSGVADVIPTTQSLQTTDFEEAKELLGFEPEMISIPLPNWSLEYYSVVLTSSNKNFSVAYKNSTYENILLFSIKYYTDIESAQNWIEQNKQGEIILIDGKSVYCADNIDNKICSWSNGSTCYSLFGPVSDEQLISIIASVKGELNDE